MFDDCIIMAGGSGTRLWPASNSRRPKQFLPLSREAGEAGKSFFSGALERALALTPGQGGRVIVIAGKSHAPHVMAACASFREEEKKRMILIPEPEARNTAPAIACGTVYAERSAGEGRNILVLTSDHIIGPLDLFKADAEAAAYFARQGKLAVFGIPPTGPETGYGYIEAGDPLPCPAAGEGEAGGKARAFAVGSFREKPDRARAENFVAAGRFYWNSGMFAFSTPFMLEEFRRSAPEALAPFEKLGLPGGGRAEKGITLIDNWPGLGDAYREAKSISVDYAVAEKCRETVVIPARFNWTDIGNWDEYAKLLKDTGSEVYSAGAKDCFVDSDIPVALAGVEGLIVSLRSGRDGSPPSLLITKKGESQRLRDIVDQIKAAGRTELL
ncbi:MAG: mannose-1-phosphate guanylyltransferase [Treponema sp.]|jgi:mannose-1-phosphate guanylyltransferase/mannose-1-phosphate guanylyltransferase/mannose-6-phosphate isomerase|nr:mannose-1-phosphate guanylyltransferase [Treponema sp.]